MIKHELARKKKPIEKIWKKKVFISFQLKCVAHAYENLAIQCDDCIFWTGKQPIRIWPIHSKPTEIGRNNNYQNNNNICPFIGTVIVRVSWPQIKTVTNYVFISIILLCPFQSQS